MPLGILYLQIYLILIIYTSSYKVNNISASLAMHSLHTLWYNVFKYLYFSKVLKICLLYFDICERRERHEAGLYKGSVRTQKHLARFCTSLYRLDVSPSVSQYFPVTVSEHCPRSFASFYLYRSVRRMECVYFR